MHTARPAASVESAGDAATAEGIADEFFRLMAAARLEAVGRWRSEELSTDQLHCLLTLKVLGPLTMGRLAELRGVSLPNATGIVGRLETHGYVERTHGDQDRRQVTAQLTEAGSDIVSELEFARRRHLVRVLGAMAREDREAFVRGFRSFFETASRLGPGTSQPEGDR
jgi:DNA-binding MarR family transcriptional regulator